MGIFLTAVESRACAMWCSEATDSGIMDMLEIKINAANYALSSNFWALVEPVVQSILSIKQFLKQAPH